MRASFPSIWNRLIGRCGESIAPCRKRSNCLRTRATDQAVRRFLFDQRKWTTETVSAWVVQKQYVATLAEARRHVFRHATREGTDALGDRRRSVVGRRG